MDVCPKNIIGFLYRMRYGMRYGCLSQKNIIGFPYRMRYGMRCGCLSQKSYGLAVYRMWCGMQYGCLSREHYGFPVQNAVRNAVRMFVPKTLWASRIECGAVCGTDVCPETIISFPYRMRCGMRYGCFSQTHPKSNALK